MDSKVPFMSKDQLDFFNAEGYLVLPRAVPAPLLLKMQQLFDELMEENNTTERAVNIHNGQSYINNLEKLCRKGNLSCLELLGTPFILETAQSICGPDFFLIQEFAVIKMLGDNLPVLWHQDMLHKRTGQCFTMGIYLDDADADDGALRIVPKSHISGKPICAAKDDPSVEALMKAGDILIHDMMLAHSSGLMKHNPIRRVLYFEFLSVSHVRNESIYSEELLVNRMQLLQIAIDFYREQHPANEYFYWSNPLGVSRMQDKTMKEELEEIYKNEVHAKPSTYCFEGLY